MNESMSQYIEIDCDDIGNAKSVASARGYFLNAIREVHKEVETYGQERAQMMANALCWSAWGAGISDEVVSRWHRISHELIDREAAQR